MDDKSLKDKAVDIKGKQYVLVSDRVLYFNEKYPKGSITTHLLSDPSATRVVVKSQVYPEGPEGRFFSGYSQAVIGEGMVNRTAALENAETSAVGRALAFMGIGVIDSVASVDEMHKAAPVASYTSRSATKPAKTAVAKDLRTERIKELLIALDAPCATVAEAQQSVKELTKLTLDPKNYDQIIAALDKKREETDPLGKFMDENN